MKNINFKKYIIFFSFLWTFTIGFALYSSIKERIEQVNENEQITAKIAYEKDLMYRRWVSKQGGVYVRISKHTPPNPYLNYIKNREVYTTVGDTLTLINPSYMTRQVFDYARNDYDLPGHLTSLNPINPVNKPDLTEREALLLFENGDTIFVKEDTLNGKLYMRYMRPFVTEQSCLKCHEQQGYKVGDVRGALSISVPTSEFKNVMKKYIKSLIINYSLIWLIGICAILFILNKLKKQIEARQKAEDTILQQNNELSRKNNELLTQTEELKQLTEFLENISKENFETAQKYKEQSITLEELNKEIIITNEELKSSLEELNSLNDNLSSKNEELDKLNATKDKFFSIIAHDLKNPFNTLMGLNELLIRNVTKYSSEKIQHFAQNMYEVSKQTYELLENLLEWSRIQNGKLISLPLKVKPSELINEVLYLTRQISILKNIDLQIEINSDENIFVDKEMIKTVLRNLVTNAIKFTNAQGKITIETQNKDKNLLFIISDSGIGIEPEHIENIFKLGSKLSKNGTANEKGTGLGLILCKEFIEKNGGTIWVESEIKKGSKFKFTVPLFIE